jgi:hypothetical protein
MTAQFLYTYVSGGVDESSKSKLNMELIFIILITLSSKYRFASRIKFVTT